MWVYKKDSGYLLDIPDSEIIAFKKIINYIIKDLDWELPIRTGFSIDEYQILEEKMGNSSLGAQIFIQEEISMIHQMLNEVCRGIHIQNFENEFGIPINEAKRILRTMDDIED
jgi:hypothetical protein